MGDDGILYSFPLKTLRRKEKETRPGVASSFVLCRPRCVGSEDQRLALLEAERLKEGDDERI